MDWTQRLRLRNLEYLSSLARTGNMSQSAEELATTQPGLSKWLKDLEQDVGMPLFERMARGLRPTAAGEAMIGHALRILSHLDAARDEMKVLHDGGQGLVTIGFAGPSSVDTVPTAVLGVLEKVPSAHIRLQEIRSEDLIAQLDAGLVDIAIGPSGMRLNVPAIRSEVLYNEPIHLVARVGHPILALPEVHWEDVMNYPWALWSRGTPVRTAFDAALVAAGQTHPPTYVESNSAALTTTLLLLSDMIGVASRRPALRWAQLGFLGIIPLRLSGVGSVTLYWREEEQDRLAVRVTLDAVRVAARNFSTPT